MKYMSCDLCDKPASWKSRAGAFLCDGHRKSGSRYFEPIEIHEDEPEVIKSMEYVFLKHDYEDDEWAEIERRFFDLESLAFRHADKLAEENSCLVDIRVIVEDESQ